MSNETLKYPKNSITQFRMKHYSDYPKINECYISGSDAIEGGHMFYEGAPELPAEPTPVDYMDLSNAAAGIARIFDVAHTPALIPEINQRINLWPINTVKILEGLQGYRGACKYIMHLGQPNEPEKDYQLSDDITPLIRGYADRVVLVGSNVPTTVITNTVPANPLEDLIVNSKLLLDLEADWDQEGALQIDQEIYAASVDFLRAYYNHIKATSYSIQLPEINPCPDGTVDLEWHTEHAQLLINFRRDKEGAITAFYYGDQFSNKEPIKGSVAAIGVKEHLAAWMKYLA